MNDDIYEEQTVPIILQHNNRPHLPKKACGGQGLVSSLSPFSYRIPGEGSGPGMSFRSPLTPDHDPAIPNAPVSFPQPIRYYHSNNIKEKT